MEHPDLLRYLADAFDRLQLRYAVTGSTATIAGPHLGPRERVSVR